MNLPIEDWDELFLAVETRLRLSAGAALDAVQLQGIVLECVDALDGLHTALRDERQLCKGMALELASTRAALVSARSVQDDALTARSRARFRDLLREALSAANSQRQAIALLRLDIDGCDGIRDRHGSEVGEALLLIVAGRLAESIRIKDKLARLSGEKFACILLDVPGREQLSHLACKVLDAIAAPLRVRELKLTVRPSIGIATCHDGATPGSAAAHRGRRHRPRPPQPVGIRVRRRTCRSLGTALGIGGDRPIGHADAFRSVSFSGGADPRSWLEPAAPGPWHYAGSVPRRCP